MSKQPTWLQRLIELIGETQAKETSKHARAKRKPQNWEYKKKVRRKMAQKSRKINRKRQ
jgi:hypothetical protein